MTEGREGGTGREGREGRERTLVATPAVCLESVALVYGATRALDDLSLALEASQTHVILGPSGSGKSTLLRLVTGLSVPTAGGVTVLGRAVTPAATDGQRAANRRTGLVLQDGGLFPHLTVEQNVCLPGALAGWSRARLSERLTELEALVGLDRELRARYPRALSGGQRQRVALQRALFLDPALLLLDEPFSALDPMTRSELQDQMKAIFVRLGKTVMLVTHDIPEALHFADTIALVERGRLVQHGPPARVLGQPASAWAADFLGAAVPRWQRLLTTLQGERAGS